VVSVLLSKKGVQGQGGEERKMILTDEEKGMLNGDYGVGVQRSMDLLVRWGELFDAERMVKVDHVHITCNFPTGCMLELSENTASVKTTSTLHAVFDPKHWRENFGIVLKKMGGYGETDEKEFDRRMGIFKNLGFYPAFTCAPYSVGFLPRPGDVLCLTGSSGQVISNSFFGARAGRESVSTSFAAAVTGRTPLMGVLKKENRYAEYLVTLGKDLDPPNFTDGDYGALGYFIGSKVESRNVAIDGLPKEVSFENERNLVSPLPVSGSCVLCHVVGVTPEARTLEEALGGKKPPVIEVHKKDLADSYQKLTDAKGKEVDMVAFGCPHLTIKELRYLASLLEGKKVSPNVFFVIGLSRTTKALAADCGYTATLEKAGAKLTNACVGPVNPLIFQELGARVAAATNSSRSAHYMQRMSGGRTKTFYGSMKKCVQAGITGKWEE
jgi:cis-L-3-hydroxyproline dehydratase